MKTPKIIVLCAALMAAGCTSYAPEKVRTGMTKDQLMEACGQPDQAYPWVLVDVYQYGNAGVLLNADTVVDQTADLAKWQKESREAMIQALQQLQAISSAFQGLE